MSIPIAKASQYTIEELTTAYNETRVDYMVPMPMSVARFAEYLHDFDVDLEHSVVALNEDRTIAGLGMLGVRTDRSWITRLGVLPQNRRHGIGEAMLSSMLDMSKSIGIKTVSLEVIKGNQRAYLLFQKIGFKETDEYLVLRRAPSPSDGAPHGKITWLSRDEILGYLKSAPRQTWINEIESMANASDLQGMHLTLEDGSSGWLAYRKTMLTLSHLVLYTQQGDPQIVGKNLLEHLYERHPRLDTYAENILAKDPQLPAFFSIGYFEAFRRIEMILTF